MTEICAPVPPIFTIGTLSESEGPVTDRSTASSNLDSNESRENKPNNIHRKKVIDGAVKRKLQQPCIAPVQNKKPRCSVGRRVPKKSPRNLGYLTRKNSTALDCKTQIPFPLPLTPSTSGVSSSNSSASLQDKGKVQAQIIKRAGKAVVTKVQEKSASAAKWKGEDKLNSVVTSEGESKLGGVSKQENSSQIKFEAQAKSEDAAQVKVESEGPATPQKPRSSVRIPKSPSLMDLNRTNRVLSKNMPLTRDSRALVRSTSSGVTACSQQSLMNKAFNHSYYYMVDDHEPKEAGIRIFATVMLNAWRKRRDEVKRLKEEAQCLKNAAVKVKNQLHVLGSLYRVEQKQNDELKNKLKNAREETNRSKKSYETLTSTVVSLKTKKALFEKQLENKNEEFDRLNELLNRTSAELYHLKAQQRELQASLSCEQCKSQLLENKKNELINQVFEVKTESLKKEEELQALLREKEAVITDAKQCIFDLEAQNLELIIKTSVLAICEENEVRLKAEIEELKNNIGTLQQCLAATLGHRLKKCWSNSVYYHNITLQVLHWAAYCTLPATPPPRTAFPFAVAFEKVLSFVKLK